MNGLFASNSAENEWWATIGPRAREQRESGNHDNKLSSHRTDSSEASILRGIALTLQGAGQNGDTPRAEASSRQTSVRPVDVYFRCWSLSGVNYCDREVRMPNLASAAASVKLRQVERALPQPSCRCDGTCGPVALRSLKYGCSTSSECSMPTAMCCRTASAARVGSPLHSASASS